MPKHRKIRADKGKPRKQRQPQASQSNSNVVKDEIRGIIPVVEKPDVNKRLSYEDLPEKLRKEIELASANRKVSGLPDDFEERKERAVRYANAMRDKETKTT